MYKMYKVDESALCEFETQAILKRGERISVEKNNIDLSDVPKPLKFTSLTVGAEVEKDK